VSPPPLSPTPDPQPADVNVKIVSVLGDFEVADTTRVYSFGEQVGTLQVNTDTPYAELPLTTQPGTSDFQLKVTIVLTPAYGGGQLTCNGSGSISAFEGATYSVQVNLNSSGGCDATLRPEDGN
jgi:hypothetical protein